MAAKRPSNELANKSNVRPTNNRFTEAWAEDFNEIGDILTDHANILDLLTGNATPAPFYGIFGSLAVLQSAFPIGEENAYAILDNGAGGTPQVAVWDNIAQQWEIGGYNGEIVWLNNIGDRPASGSENTIYIIKDSGDIFYWNLGAWELLNETVIGGVSEDADNSLTLGSDDRPYFKQRTASELKSAYESNADTNAFTDQDKSFLGSAVQPSALDNYFTKTDSDNRFAPLTRTFGNGQGIQPIGDLTVDRNVSLDFDYLDGRYLTGFKQRQAVRATTSGNITLSGLQTIDGVALVAGNRVLVKDQTNAAQNGVYVSASGAWTRSADFDEPNLDEVAQGASVFVEEGTNNARTGWSLSTPSPIVVGTTPLDFIQYAGANNYTGGNNITINGNAIDHNAKSWVDKAALSGATVISNISVDAYGHPTNWTTRNLTPANIGAESAFAKNPAFNKTFGAVAGTVAEGNHTHTFTSITGRPTTIGGYGITDFNSLGDARWLKRTTDTFTGNIRINQSSVNDRLELRRTTNGRAESALLAEDNTIVWRYGMTGGGSNIFRIHNALTVSNPLSIDPVTNVLSGNGLGFTNVNADLLRNLSPSRFVYNGLHTDIRNDSERWYKIGTFSPNFFHTAKITIDIQTFTTVKGSLEILLGGGSTTTVANLLSGPSSGGRVYHNGNDIYIYLPAFHRTSYAVVGNGFALDVQAFTSQPAELIEIEIEQSWTSTNGGSGSGMDSDTTDGKHIWTGTEANLPASRNSNTIYLAY